MHQEELKFYPVHPLGEKTHLIETTPIPIREQSAPYPVKPLADTFRYGLG